AYREAGTYRGAAAICGTTPKTVRRVNARYEAGGGAPLFIEPELLAPLPSLRASIGRHGTRKVDRLSCVRFGPARYPVPACLIGTQVRVRTDDGRLLVMMPGADQVVAGHVLVAPGETSVRVTTTARRGGRCGRKPPRRRSPARSARSRRRSSPAPRQPGTPGWDPS